MLLLTNPYTGSYHEITGMLLQLLILFTDSSTTTLFNPGQIDKEEFALSKYIIAGVALGGVKG